MRKRVWTAPPGGCTVRVICITSTATPTPTGAATQLTLSGKMSRHTQPTTAEKNCPPAPVILLHQRPTEISVRTWQNCQQHSGISAFFTCALLVEACMCQSGTRSEPTDKVAGLAELRLRHREQQHRRRAEGRDQDLHVDGGVCRPADHAQLTLSAVLNAFTRMHASCARQSWLLDYECIACVAPVNTTPITATCFA